MGPSLHGTQLLSELITIVITDRVDRRTVFLVIPRALVESHTGDVDYDGPTLGSSRFDRE